MSLFVTDLQDDWWIEADLQDENSVLHPRQRGVSIVKRREKAEGKERVKKVKQVVHSDQGRLAQAVPGFPTPRASDKNDDEPIMFNNQKTKQKNPPSVHIHTFSPLPVRFDE